MEEIMQEYNIIADIAGQYDTLLALLAKMPSTAIPLSVGDMIDRGPQSKEVLEFFMNKGQAILGNHEHFMITEYEKPFYDKGIWLANGGRATLKSFFPDLDEELLKDYTYYDYHNPNAPEKMSKGEAYYKQLVSQLPSNIIEWLKQLPLYIMENGLFVSHAPKNPVLSLERVCDLNVSVRRIDETLIWNRGTSRRMKDHIQIAGHNSSRSVRHLSDEQGVFAIDIDTSSAKILTGIHWPSLVIYQQEYLGV
jgi:hypothetical protein